MPSSSVFISHAPEDLEVAARLDAALEAQGLSTRRCSEEFRSGEHWPEETGRLISDNNCYLLLWSKDSARSGFVEFELTTAIALNKRVVSVRLDETPLTHALSARDSLRWEELDSTVGRVLSLVQVPGMAGDSGRTAGVLATLKGVSHADPESMAEAGTMLMSGLGPSADSATLANASSALASSTTASRPITEGAQFGQRYRVVRMLGQGGMGAVYHCFDTELERDVALKVIRRELAEEPMILKRFKREIQLSSEVTHPNVLRVYDLGEAEGVKFLTMQFVDGEDLTSLMKRESPLTPERVTGLFSQICGGLAAAHDKGVVHRDLKPANIMVSRDGRVLVTDFGLATAADQSGLTQAGAVMGTPHYMSPEQVKGEAADAQSDIYSLGVILYELITGQLPFAGNTIFEVMIQRTQKEPVSVSTLRPDVPPFLVKIVAGCMARDKENRYSTVAEVLSDLEQGTKVGETILASRLERRRRWSQLSTARWIRAVAVVILLLLVVLGGLWVFRQTAGPPDSVTQLEKQAVSVLVSDFRNETGDALFEGVLEETLASTLEGASFITTYNRGSARTIAEQLQPGAASLDEELSRLVAQREGISVIITGAIESRGEGLEISVRALDALTGNEIDKATIGVGSRADVLSAVGKLSAGIRRTLGDTTPESAQLAAAETYTASTLESAQALARGLEAFGEGKWDEAVRQYNLALESDSELGRAYAGLAAIYRNAGQPEKAEEEFSRAMQYIDRMSEREGFKVRGGFFLVVGNYPKAVEEFEGLIEKYPADFVGQINLALAHFLARDMDAAMQAARRATEIYPRNVMARSNLALYAMYSGDFETAISQSMSVLRDYPEYADLYLCLGLAQLAQGNVSAANEQFQRLANTDEWGASMAAMGFADIALYEGRYRDAASILRRGITRDRESGDETSALRKSLALAGALVKLGEEAEALARVKEVTEKDTRAAFAYEAAHTLLALGRDGEALELAAELGGSVRPESKMYGLLIQGEAYLKAGDRGEAVQRFQEAQALFDTWLGRFGLGRSYLEAEAFTEAYSEFDQCLKRRGEAVAVYLDDVPSSRYLPPVYYYLGRAQEGLRSPAFQESFRRFAEIRSKSDPDPMVTDARRRLVAE